MYLMNYEVWYTTYTLKTSMLSWYNPILALAKLGLRQLDTISELKLFL